MPNAYIQSILPFLHELQPLEPLPAGCAPSASACPGIRAVVWDVYGTLLISASGDINQATFSEHHLLRACRAAGINLVSPHPEVVARRMLQEFQSRIQLEHARSRNAGVPWPEIDARSIWQQVFSSFSDNISVPAQEHKLLAEIVAFVFELLSNPVWPMPGMCAVLSRLHTQNFLLGIVSNAQFYTPVILNYFFSGMIDDLPPNAPFASELCLYSYSLLRAKPGRELFDRLVSRARDSYNLQPHEILYVGNDIRNDILPAARAGLKTTLFAGDARSLRLRENDPDCAGVEPDFIITDLRQLCSRILTRLPGSS